MTFSIIQKSQLEKMGRIDADYYQPKYLKLEKKLLYIPTDRMADISTSIVNFGAYSLCNYIVWQESGIPYLNVENIKEGYIDFENVKYIDEKVNEILNKSKVKEGQVILPMAGTIGNSAIAYKVPVKINSNQATAKITLKQNISPFYVTAFLNSYYGKMQIIREILSSVQPNIFLWQIKNFRIPVATKKKQAEIEKLWIKGLDELESSKKIYQQAEELLLKELGLENVIFEDRLSCVINYSDVVFNNRMDAEYFQPKYQKLIEKIKSQNAKSLGDLVSMKKGFEPGSEAYQEEGKLFIRVSSVSKLGIEEKDQKYLSDDLYRELKKNYEPKLGDILLTKDATPGIAYVIKEPLEGIISGGILDLKVKENIKSEYLALCISSIVGRWQAQRDAGGSTIAHWKPEQIRNLLIPILPMDKQKEIVEMVRKSHEARKKSKELLEEAKRKVEEMIEKQAN
jgi:type I restriction enzyme, S subunit